MSDSSDIFAASGVDAPEQPAPDSAQPYRVLARKYRPASFDELIGQDAMVQTLGNAIKRKRLAHAFLMTGVRGVGKTTTARLIAKALNCIGEDGQGGPTIDPCNKCDPCRGIAEGRFIDVLEMDAASNTQVDKMRDILDNVPYAAVSGRYKIYIIDEVHMLSKSSFNALLKTLEEPPDHVKFIFATTEVNKVPITVLSRCQRFDLKRISAGQLSTHFGQIVAKEGVSAEQEALDLIAQAAEGSVRDGLSILDQAIAHSDMDGDGEVKATQIREMLGLSDRSAGRRLFGLLLSGEAQALLDAIDGQYQIGVEPLSLMNGLLNLTHQVTLNKVGRVNDPTYSDEAKAQMAEWADRLSYPVLHRLWQLLLKGYEEIRQAHMPREACDMALLRVLCAADMPDPGELAKMLSQNAAQPSKDGEKPVTQSPGSEDPVVQPQPAHATEEPAPLQNTQRLPDSFDEVVDIVGRVSPVLESILIADMRVVKFAAPEIIYQSARSISDSDLKKISDTLKDQTGVQWTIAEGQGEAQPSIAEKAQQSRDAARQEILDSPLVKAAFEAFPDAELLEDGEEGLHHSNQESRSA